MSFSGKDMFKHIELLAEKNNVGIVVYYPRIDELIVTFGPQSKQFFNKNSIDELCVETFLGNFYILGEY